MVEIPKHAQKQREIQDESAVLSFNVRLHWAAGSFFPTHCPPLSRPGYFKAYAGRHALPSENILVRFSKI